MPTKRRRAAVVYKDESSSDSEEEIDPKLKKAKMKLKQLENENDSGSDFERDLKIDKKKGRDQSSEDNDDFEEEIIQKIKKAQPKAKLATKVKKISTKKIQRHSEDNDDFEEEISTKIKKAQPKSKLALKVKKISTEKNQRHKITYDILSKNTKSIPSLKYVNQFTSQLVKNVKTTTSSKFVEQKEKVKIDLEKISLSESDSSDDDMEERRKVIKINGKSLTKSPLFTKTIIDTPDEGDDMVANNKLMALAGDLDKIKNAWKEDPTHSKRTIEETSSSSKKKKSKNNDDDFNVSKLLAQGEGTADNDLSSDDDNDETVVKSPVKPPKSIQINVALPENRKRKKKGFDLDAYLKRQLSKGRRELQVVLHQCHYLCLVAHLRYLNQALEDEMLQSVALSLVPTAHCHSLSNLTLPRLQGLVSWLRDALPITKDNVGALSVPLQSSLLNKLKHFVVSNEVEMVLIFVLICRALGYDTRLVLNLSVVSLKPEALEEENVETQKNEGTSTEQTTKKKKPSKTCSDDEGEEFPKPKSKDKSLSSKLAAAAGKRATSVNHKSKGKGSPEEREAALLESLEKKDTGESREQFNQKTIDKLTKKKGKDKSGESSKKPTTKKKTKEVKPGMDYWCEVFVGKWITVDIVNGKSNCSGEMEGRATKPVTYVLADNGLGIKDVTKRYAANFMTKTRKIRCTQDWLDGALRGIKMAHDSKTENEDKEIDKRLEKTPMPTTVSGFKDHPLYALERHLLKFEAIYPPSPLTLGFIKSEPVYARECVHAVLGRTAWLKEGRTVILNQEPYKVVKARPKWDRMTGSKVSDEPLDLFGKWQTELYIPKPAENGIVPRNEYGSVELFKPWMLPIGCAHLPINTLKGTARRLNIDAAPAMVGWEFSGGGAHPVYDGYVVVEERVEELMDAWNKEQEEKEERDKEKREARILGNWKKLVKGLIIKQRIQARYLDTNIR